MNFLTQKKPRQDTFSEDSYVFSIENYIYNTKVHLENNVEKIFTPTTTITSWKKRQSIQNLSKRQTELTIKPAVNNLGIVLLDTNDYISECV